MMPRCEEISSVTRRFSLSLLLCYFLFYCVPANSQQTANQREIRFSEVFQQSDDVARREILELLNSYDLVVAKRLLDTNDDILANVFLDTESSEKSIVLALSLYSRLEFSDSQHLQMLYDLAESSRLSGGWRSRFQALTVLATSRGSQRDLEFLYVVSLDPEEHSEVRATALKLLREAHIDWQAENDFELLRIIDLMTDEMEAVRIAAVELFASAVPANTSPDCEQRLLRLLDTPGPDQEAALSAVARMESVPPSAVSQVGRILNFSTSKAARTSAYHAALATAPTERDLSRLLEDSFDIPQRERLLALATTRDIKPSLLPDLRPHLLEADPRVRTAALNVVESFGLAPQYLKALIHLARLGIRDDPSGSLRSASISALISSRITRDAAYEEMLRIVTARENTPLPLQEMIHKTFWRYPDRANDHLSAVIDSLTSDESPIVQIKAIRLISNKQSVVRSHLPALEKIFLDIDASTQVRGAAMDAIVSSGQAERFLEPMLDALMDRRRDGEGVEGFLFMSFINAIRTSGQFDQYTSLILQLLDHGENDVWRTAVISLLEACSDFDLEQVALILNPIYRWDARIGLLRFTASYCAMDSDEVRVVLDLVGQSDLDLSAALPQKRQKKIALRTLSLIYNLSTTHPRFRHDIAYTINQSVRPIEEWSCFDKSELAAARDSLSSEKMLISVDAAISRLDTTTCTVVRTTRILFLGLIVSYTITVGFLLVVSRWWVVAANALPILMGPTGRRLAGAIALGPVYYKSWQDVMAYLQDSKSTNEMVRILGETLPRIFPDLSGSLLGINVGGKLEILFSWNSGEGVRGTFPIDACWAARSRQAHEYKKRDVFPPCEHTLSVMTNYLCVPINSREGILGIMTIGTPEDRGMSRRQRIYSERIGEELAPIWAKLREIDELSRQLQRDSLTGLYNRGYFDKALRLEIERSLSEGKTFGLVMADIDHFKAINDGYGHDVGDIVLKVVAETLQANTRPGDIACRYGGEEFAVVLPEADVNVAKRRAEEFCHAIRSIEFAELSGRDDSRVTVSVGVATFPEHGDSVAELLRSADQALYLAKKGGRDGVAVFEIMKD